MKMKKIIVALLVLFGLLIPNVSANASTQHVHHIRLIKSVHVVKKQARYQRKPKLIKKVRKTANHKVNKNNWFRDGLSNRQLKARQKVVSMESGGRWSILSYGHRCIGYFQLDPAYLGYKHGKVNLNHKHQVKTADSYVKSRYGTWTHALSFHYSHGWY